MFLHDIVKKTNTMSKEIQEEKKNIGSLFDGIAGTYDFLNHALSLNIDKSWRRKTVKMLEPCDCLLDVAIGTADLSLEIMKQGKAKKIQGIDLSKEMMRIGQEKAEKLGYGDKISFECGSALDMPYKDQSFDALTCAYGVRNFSDLDKGLQEFYRTLKDGGQLVILEFSYPSNPIIRFFYDLFFSNILPFIGRLVSNDKSAYSYLNRSVKDFFWGEEMIARLTSVGFRDAKFRTLTFGITTIYTARK